MSIDLAPTSQSPAPAVAPRIGKRSDSPIETPLTVLGEDGEFANLLSAMDGDSSFQAERPPLPMPASNPQRSREGKADSTSKPPVPSDVNGAPQGPSNVTANASLVNLTWPASFMRAGLQETAVSETDGAARSNLGQVTSAQRNVSLKDDAGDRRADLLQQHAVGQMLATDDERLSISQMSFPLDARLGIDATHRQGRLENSVVLMPSTVIEHEAIPHETIQNVTISSLETHFPAVLSTMLADRAAVPNDNEQRNASVHVAPASQLAETRQPIGAPIKILTLEFENVAPRQSLERAFGPDDEGLFVSRASLSRGAQPEIEAKPEPERPANTVDAAPSETIRHVAIKSLETHFPAVAPNMLVERALVPTENERRSVSIHIAPTSQLAETRQQIGAPTKILTLELEPASLGTITVRMKMSRSNVDLQISVDSVDALHALHNARDKLVEAIQSSGCAVDSCTIHIGPTPTSADSAQYMAGGGGQNMASSGSERTSRTDIGQGGAEHGAKNDNPRQEPQDPRSRTSGDATSSRLADHIHGLYL